MKKVFLGIIILIVILLSNIKSIDTTKYGCLLTFKDNTGYYIEF